MLLKEESSQGVKHFSSLLGQAIDLSWTSFFRRILLEYKNVAPPVRDGAIGI